MSTHGGGGSRKKTKRSKKSKSLCKNFKTGRCTYGGKCRYKHDGGTTSATPPAPTTSSRSWPMSRHTPAPITPSPLIEWIHSLSVEPPPAARSTTLAVPTKKKMPSPHVPPRPQGRLRFMSINSENMDRLLPRDSKKPLSATQHETCQRLSRLISDVNPDVATVVEGPSTVEKMERFIYDYLDDEYDIVGGLDGGSQRVFCLVRRCSRTYSMTASIPLAADQYFASSWKVDVTGDCVMTRYSYLRRPLLTEIVIRSAEGTTRRLIVIGLHLKSKHLAGGRVLWETDDIDDRMTYIKKAVETRRRIAAEIQRCRNLIDLMMDENPDLDVIVAGDVNDGPGADLFEQRYLLSNASDALLGSPI